ncbi:MAG: MarR family transcriptional regulator [Rhodobacteraceae bacterium]|nr:MarR family transcriptional regulator [Paracoccaceae bacterium]
MTDPRPTPLPPPEISDATLRRFVGYHMKRAFNVVQADLTATLGPFRLRMLTYSALVLVCDNPGLSQTRLAAAMDIERPNLVVIVDELERRGLITRDRVPTDRRAYALMPTPSGRRLCGQAIKAVEAHEARLFAGLDDTTRQTLVAVLSALRATPNS